MTAIETVYYPPTKTRGARIRAKAGGWPAHWYLAPADSVNPFADAAVAYCHFMNWSGAVLIEGSTLNGRVFVFADSMRHAVPAKQPKGDR